MHLAVVEERVVTTDLAADDQALVTTGDTVEIDLPDGTRATGTVATVGTGATTPADGQEAARRRRSRSCSTIRRPPARSTRQRSTS